MQESRGVTRQVAQFALNSRWSDLPEKVRHEGVRAFFNWVGCALGGCGHPAVDAALDTVAEFAGPSQATILGRGRRMDVVNATLINGLSASAHAFDDTHLKSIAHPTAPAGAALLAIAERQPVSGSAFIHALIIANEIQCRLANALAVPPARCHVGFYMTGLTGGVGVAAAAGRLLGLNEKQVLWAMATGACQGGGFRNTHATMCSGYIPGHAGRNGLIAALLAAKGFTGPEEMLEARNGFTDVFAAPANLSALTDGLGTHFEIMAIAAKPYPTGCFIHPSIDACLELSRVARPDPEAIERVDLRVHPLGLGLTGRAEPKHAYDAQISVYHWAAAVLARGTAGLAETSDACVQDPVVVALRRRVHATTDDALSPDEARATLTMKDGRVFDVHVPRCLGSADRPMSDAQLEAKFIAQAEGMLPPDRLRVLVDRCWTIDRAADVGGMAPGVWGQP